MPLDAFFLSTLVPNGDASSFEPSAITVGAIGAVMTILAAALSNAGLARRIRAAMLAVALRPSAWLAILFITAVVYQVRRDRATLDDARSPARPATLTIRTDGDDAPVGDDWPVERGSNLRHARVGDSPGPGRSPPSRRWRFGRSDEAYHGSPAVRGNTVFAVGSEARQARVVALSVDEGRLLWSSGPRDYRPTFAGPVVVGPTLFAAEGLHSTRQARVFALDLRPRREGAVLWQYTTASHVECTPAVVERRVYFNAGDDGVYGFQTSSPNPTDPPRAVTPRAVTPRTDAPLQPLFHRPGDEMPDAETSLLVEGDRVYAGLGVGGQAVVLLDAATGVERRRVATPHPVFAPPALFENRLFVGMGGGDYANPSQARAGALWRLDAETLASVWRRDLPATVLGAVVVDSTHVIVGCGDGRVVAFDHDGEIAAEWNVGAPIAASLALTPDFLYGVTESGSLFALDRRRREIAWRVTIGRTGHYMSGPVVTGDRLVFGTPFDGLVCYGP